MSRKIKYTNDDWIAGERVEIVKRYAVQKNDWNGKGRDIKVEKEKISGIKQQCFSSIDSRADAIFELGRCLVRSPGAWL